MTIAELDKLIEQTEHALKRTDDLLRDAHELVKAEQKEAEHEKREVRRGAAEVLAHANLLSAKRGNDHKKRLSELAKDIHRLEHEIIPRIETEHSRLQDGLDHLKQLHSQLDSVLSSCDGWRKNLESIIHTVEREHL